MVTIKNVCVQGLELILHEGRKALHHWLEPKQSLVVPATFLSPTVKTLAERQLLSIRKNQ